MKYFATSDNHFSHSNIIKYCNRPFSNTKEMDDEMIHQVNRTVGADDILFNLGDFCMNKPLSFAQQFRDRIKCKRIVYLWGNHCDRSIAPLFTECHDLLEANVNGQFIVMCHYAMAVWNKSHKGSWMWYGHSHADIEDIMDEKFPDRRSMDVGVDNAYRLLGEYRPFSFGEIKDIFKDRKVGFHHS